jgi:hypothetical protein
VSSNAALDAVCTGENAGFGHVAISELQSDFVRVLFDFCQSLAASYVLGWDEAGHDF